MKLSRRRVSAMPLTLPLATAAARGLNPLLRGEWPSGRTILVDQDAPLFSGGGISSVVAADLLPAIEAPDRVFRPLL